MGKYILSFILCFVLSFASAESDSLRIAKAMHDAQEFASKGNQEAARQSVVNIEEILYYSKDSATTAFGNLQLGNYYVETEKNDSLAEAYYLRSIEHYQGLDDQLLTLGTACNALAYLYFYQGKKILAVDYLEKAMLAWEEAGTPEAKKRSSVVLTNLAIFYYELKLLGKAHEIAIDAIEVNKADSLKFALSANYDLLALIEEERGDLTEAYKYRVEALRYASESVNERQASWNAAMASLLVRILDSDSINIDEVDLTVLSLEGVELTPYIVIEYYLDRAVKLSGEFDELLIGMQVLAAQGEYEYHKGNYQQAITYYKEALNLRDGEGIAWNYALYHNISSSYEALGDHELALEYYKKYVTIRDSVEEATANIELAQKSTAIEYSLKLLKKQHEADLFAERTRKQQALDKLAWVRERYAIGFGLFILLSVAGAYLRRRYLRSVNERNELLKEIERLKLEGSKQVVTSQDGRSSNVLNKEKLEAAISGKLNETDWKILQILFKNPTITNKEIAAEVFLGVEGVSSSLQKMYRLFEIEVKAHHKIHLIMKVVMVSNAV